MEWTKVLFLSASIFLGLSMVATEPFNIWRLYIVGGICMLMVAFGSIFEIIKIINKTNSGSIHKKSLKDK